MSVANGVTDRDSIIFNLADNSVAGRTITLLSPLPALSSNTVINGASQTGTPIGVSDARIILFHSATGTFKFLEMHDCSDMAIYGMAMISTANNPPDTVAGISYVRCHNLQIGQPGSGNYMLGCTHAIFSNTQRYSYYIYGDTSRNLVLQSNVIGLDLNGGFSCKYNGIPLAIMYYSLYLLNTSDITIGGDDPAQGNTIVQGFSIPFNYPGGTGYNIDIETYRDTGMGQLIIKNNHFGTRKDGSLDPNYRLFQVIIAIQGNFRTDYKIQIKNNILQGQIYMDEMGNYFYIQGNTIFSNYTNDVYDCAITVQQSNGGIIGGSDPGDANTITNAYTDTVYYFKDNSFDGCLRADVYSHVTVLNNVTLCNAYHSSTILDDNPSIFLGPVYVRIDSTGIGFVRGKATPDTRVDVYLDDDCDACEGKQYLGFVMANPDSSWQYTGSFSSGVVATATNTANGLTSPFSAPVIYALPNVIKQPTCGKNNGYIRGLVIQGGDNVKWHYMYLKNGVWVDSIYSRSLNLENAEPGIYFVDAWLGKSCRSYYARYDLTNQTVALDSSRLAVQQPGCGKFNGSIKGMSLSYSTGIQVYWENESGTIVSNQLDLTGAGPGKYKIVFKDTAGGCADSSGVYALVNQSGPTVDVGTAVVTNATCNNDNGSIGNLNYSNVTGVPYYQWIDSLGRAVGNAPSLSGVSAGSYRLKFKDGGTCDTIVTSVFVIGDAGVISIDSSALTVTPSKCSGPTGGLTGLRASGASSYEWISLPDGIQMGNSSDLTDIGQGLYQLIVTSPLGCKDSSRVFAVGTTPIQPLSVTSKVTEQESCDRKNGSIQITGTVPDAGGFSFVWVDSSTQQQIGTGLSIDQLPAGTYFCQATDANGCTQTFWTSHLLDLPAPAITVDPSLPYPDTCATHSGGIPPPEIVGSSPYSYVWYSASGDSISNSAGLRGVGAGSYHVSVTDANGCKSVSSSFNVKNIDITLPAPVYPAQYVLKGGTANLVPEYAVADSCELYGSSPGGIPEQVSADGVFTVGPVTQDMTVYVLTRKGECAGDPVEVPIQVLLTLELIVPNAFTPNGDGHNDLFRVKNPGLVKQFDMQVFNRWGQLVFSTKDPFEGWTGTAGGQPSPAGVYAWSIHYIDVTGKQNDRRGTVILIR